MSMSDGIDGDVRSNTPSASQTPSARTAPVINNDLVTWDVPTAAPSPIADSEAPCLVVEGNSSYIPRGHLSHGKRKEKLQTSEPDNHSCAGGSRRKCNVASIEPAEHGKEEVHLTLSTGKETLLWWLHCPGQAAQHKSFHGMPDPCYIYNGDFTAYELKAAIKHAFGHVGSMVDYLNSLLEYLGREPYSGKVKLYVESAPVFRGLTSSIIDRQEDIEYLQQWVLRAVIEIGEWEGECERIKRMIVEAKIVEAKKGEEWELSELERLGYQFEVDQIKKERCCDA